MCKPLHTAAEHLWVSSTICQRIRTLVLVLAACGHVVAVFGFNAALHALYRYAEHRVRTFAQSTQIPLTEEAATAVAAAASHVSDDRLTVYLTFITNRKRTEPKR